MLARAGRTRNIDAVLGGIAFGCKNERSLKGYNKLFHKLILAVNGTCNGFL